MIHDDEYSFCGRHSGKLNEDNGVRCISILGVLPTSRDLMWLSSTTAVAAGIVAMLGAHKWWREYKKRSGFRGGREQNERWHPPQRYC